MSEKFGCAPDEKYIFDMYIERQCKAVCQELVNHVWEHRHAIHAEFGYEAKVQFALSSTLKDTEGKELLCKCGKPAGMAIIGTQSFQGFCKECSPVQTYEAEMIYRSPTKETE